MCAKSNTQIYVTWTSNNRVISLGDLYYCLLPLCEALRTCRTTFLITTQEIYFLVFRMPNTWKWPEMNMYLDLNLATFQSVDGFGCYHFCLNRFGLELIIFFWTLGKANNSDRNWDLNKIRFPYLHYILQYSFWIGFESEKVESLYWYLEKTQVTVWDPLPGSQYSNIALNHDEVSIYCALLTPQWKQNLRSRLPLCTLGRLILKNVA